MPTYVIALDEEQSGAPVEAEGGRSIPSPAVVRMRRDGETLEYEIRVELVEGAWPVVTQLLVRSTDDPPRALTAARLRDMKFGQLQRACVSYLRRGPILDGRWAQETFKLLEDVAELQEWEHRSQEQRRKNLLPDLVFDTRPDAKWGFRAAPDWLARVKAGGARSDVALRAAAEIYRTAVENGQSPNAQVERLLELPKSTASEWIRKAREKGYLEQSPRKPRADRKRDA